jgi:hypothetical protein
MLGIKQCYSRRGHEYVAFRRGHQLCGASSGSPNVWGTVGVLWSNNYSINIYTDIYCSHVSRTALSTAAGMPRLQVCLLCRRIDP